MSQKKYLVFGFIPSFLRAFRKFIKTALKSDIDPRIIEENLRRQRDEWYSKYRMTMPHF